MDAAAYPGRGYPDPAHSPGGAGGPALLPPTQPQEPVPHHPLRPRAREGLR